jgi:hypothetical protein
MSQANGQVDLGKVRIDPAKLKLRELVEIEKLVGRKLSAEFGSGELGMDTMQALLWMGLRRQDPSVTFEQAGEYEFDALTGLLSDDEDEDGGVDPTRSLPPSAANGPSLSGEPNSKPMPSSTSSGG